MKPSYAIASLLFLGVLSACEQKVPQAPVVSTPPPPLQNGRYVIVVSPHLRADTFLLDTQLGKIWTPTKYSDLVGEPIVWEDMLIVDSGQGAIPGSITSYEFIKAFPKKNDGSKKR